MIVRLAKDYKHYEILYESQEEAIVVKEYLDELLLRGVTEGIEQAVWVTPHTPLRDENKTNA